MINAGQLDKRVKIQQATEARDAHGQPIETWSDLASVWASIEPLRGREFFAARQFQAETTHKVTIRHRAGIGPRMRLLFGSRVFRIEAVIDPRERHEALELMCVEILS